MKILVSLTYYSPYISGLTLYAKRIAEAFAARHTVRVLSMQYDRNLSSHEVLHSVTVIRTPYIARISKGFISFSWFVESVRQVYWCDALMIHLPQPEALWTVFVAKILRKKVVVIYHCDVRLPSFGINGFIEKGLTFVHMLILGMADTIFSSSQDYATHSPLLKKFFKKLRFAYPPVMQPVIESNVQFVIKKKTSDYPGFTIGIASRIASEKGIEYVLESLPYILQTFQCRVLIAGPENPVGEEEYKQRVQRLLKRYGDVVVQLGEIKGDMGSFYSLLDVLVVSSVNSTEAFGMVQAEAMMMGIPVIATDLPGIRVPVQETGMGMIIPPRDSRKIAESVIQVLKHKNLYVHPKTDPKELFSMEKTVEEIEKSIL